MNNSKLRTSCKEVSVLQNITFSLVYSIMLPLFVILTLWTLESRIIGSPVVLPSPLVVFERLFLLMKTSDFWISLGSTTLRTVSAFTISLVLSAILGTLTGLFRPLAGFFSFPLGIIKAAPVVSFILLAVFWFTTDMVIVFIGILMTLPVMTAAIASGIRNVDKKLIDMANIYRFTRFQKIIHVYKPSVMPFFLSGFLTAFSYSWKVVVAAEVLSLPSTGIGTDLNRSKVHIETADVFAYTIAIILLSFILEHILAALLEKKLPAKMRSAK